MSMMHISVKDAKQLCCKTRDEFVEAVISLQEERDELLEALIRAEHKLQAYVGICDGDKELTDAVLPMSRAAIAKAIGKSSAPVNDTVKLHRAGSFGGAE